jgi:hypothetical protein
VSYTKLFSHIIRSTIWQAEPTVKVVWITMLAIADRHGSVQSSIPGLAKDSGVSIEECLKALEHLSSPDKWSRTKDSEGRRISEMDGGWLILNYCKYRAQKDMEHERETARERMRRLRAKPVTSVRKRTRNIPNSDALSRSVTESSLRDPIAAPTPAPAPSPETETENVVEPPAAPEAPTQPVEEPEQQLDARAHPGDGDTAASEAKAEPKPPSWTREACDLWITRFGGTAPGGKIGKALKPLVEKHGWPAIKPGWLAYLEGVEALYASPARFAETYGTWARPEAVAPQPEAAGDPGGGEIVAPEPPKPDPPPTNGFGPGSEDAVQLWDSIAERLKTVLATQNHATWIRPMRGLRIEDGADPQTNRPAKILALVVPDRMWIQHLKVAGYVARMRIAAEDLGHRGMLFRVIVEQKPPPEPHDGSVK